MFLHKYSFEGLHGNCIQDRFIEGRDLAHIAQLTAQLLQEGCDVMALVQQRLAQLPA